jgi:SulP family sulfate permease
VRQLLDFFPFTDVRGTGLAGYGRDAAGALTLMFLTIPQGVAYAIIAGLPPAMGLYAACLPTVIGGLFRSSRHVVTAPSNAISLLVGSILAAQADLDPVNTALLLALMVGVIQLAAGVLRFGVLIEYISMPVVAGYITGAGVLIGAGQLHNLTETEGGAGNIASMIITWLGGLGDAAAVPIVVGLATAVTIVGLRVIDRRLPGSLIALAGATAVVALLDLDTRQVEDLATSPAGWLPFALPSFGDWELLVPGAIAVAVLSLVESSALARALASRSAQRLDMSVEFSGQGLANIAAGFTGGYPASGSLSRSALNLENSASRMSGVMSGVMLAAALVFLGPLIDAVPIAALAGLLLIVAADLVDLRRIRQILASRRSDATAFAITLVATWVLRLDHAIYAGVAISLFFYLRRARLLEVSRIAITASGDITEDPIGEGSACRALVILQVKGQLFFGAAGELRDALDDASDDPTLEVLIVRVRQTQHLDVTIARVFAESARRLREAGKRLVLVGVQSETRAVLEGAGAVAEIGEANIYARSDWVYRRLHEAVVAIHEDLPEHECNLPL